RNFSPPPAMVTSGGQRYEISSSVASEDDKAALAETFRKHDFHPLCLLIRHGIQMGVKLRNQALTVLPNDLRGFDACFVILKTDLRRQSRHPHVIAGLAVPVRIPQVDDVDRMMSGPFRGFHASTIRRESTLTTLA